MGDLCVDVSSSPRHVARANGFATCGFHGFVQFARHFTLGGIAGMGLTIVVATVQGHRIRSAAREHHFVPCHSA